MDRVSVNTLTGICRKPFMPRVSYTFVPGILAIRAPYTAGPISQFVENYHLMVTIIVMSMMEKNCISHI